MRNKVLTGMQDRTATCLAFALPQQCGGDSRLDQASCSSSL
ncbi:hypothetical protein [Paenibacillus sp. Lou8.1]|nr:hypothetical protein [Paenibacillus sp. Lou8.1]